MNDSYVKALKSDDEATLAKINEELSTQNKFKSNEADKLRKIDVRNLTDGQKRELNQFAADLINQVRKQYGSPLVKVTKGSMDFANTVVRKDEANGYQMDDAHDVKAINEAAREFGLYDGGKLQFYENLFSYGFNDDEYENEYKHLGVNADQFYTKTMDEAKERIYTSMSAFLFNGYEWQHARSILGYTNEPSYLGVGIGHGLAVGKTHFELVRPDYIQDPSKFDTTEVELDNPTARIEKAKEAVKYAEDTLNTAKSELSIKQTDLENAKSHAAETNKALETAKERLEAAKAIKEQTPEAMAQLAAAKDNLLQAEAAKEVADENLKSFSKSKEEKEQALADAKAKLASDKDELTKRQGILATVEKTYAEAAETLKTAEENFQITADVFKDAQATLKQAQDKVDALKNAPQRLEEATKALKQAELDYEKALELQRTSETELKDAQAELDKAVHEYDVLKAQYNAYQATVKPDTKPSEGTRQLVEVKDNKEHSLKAEKVTQRTNQVVTYSRVARNQELPKTGSTGSVLTMLGLGVLGLIGIAYPTSKKEDR